MFEYVKKADKFGDKVSVVVISWTLQYTHQLRRPMFKGHSQKKKLIGLKISRPAGQSLILYNEIEWPREGAISSCVAELYG
jgi:hypothetical protein